MKNYLRNYFNYMAKAFLLLKLMNSFSFLVFYFVSTKLVKKYLMTLTDQNCNNQLTMLNQ